MKWGIIKTILRPIVFAFCVITVLLGCGGSKQPVQLLTITTASLPNGTLGVPYSQTIQAGGGAAPFTWAVVGALPHNLQFLSSTGNTATISGTPDTAVQSVLFSIRVSDSADQSAIASYTVSILKEPDTLSFSPATGLSFSPQMVGIASATQTVTLTNGGTSPVVIINVATSGDFMQSNMCPSSLAAGANCAISVAFAPRQPGPINSTITVTDDTIASPHFLSLSGIGLTSGPDATLSVTGLLFGNTTVGKTSGPFSITLSNYGVMSLEIAGVMASANFGESDNCSGTNLAPAASCTINVTFTPSIAGLLTGTLSVVDNATTNPQTAALTGVGVAGMCIPQGGLCYGPDKNQCCPASSPHHSFCSNPTGYGTCTES
jgi:hypothetical protein